MRKWFLDMSIATRLGLGFGAIVFLIVIFGLSALQQMNRLQKQSDILYNHPFTVTRSVDAAVIEVLKIHREMKDLAHAVDRDKIRAHESRVSMYDEEALRHLETVKSQFLGDPQTVKKVYQLLIDWRPIRDEVIQLRLEGDLAAADAITRGKGAHHVSLLESEFKELRLFAARKADASLANAEVILRESTMVISLVLAAALLLGIAIAIPITRSIRIPLTRLDRATAQVSQGDLDQQVVVTSQDELGRLSSTFNSMVVSIREQTEEIQRKNEENERLLLNILPGPIADRLKQGEETIADNFPEVTVLFADIVGFTALSDSVSPNDLVTMLNQLFTAFDDSAHHLGIEKIKTIGDCYMAVAGLTIELDDPPVAMVEMALEMHRAIDQFNAQHGTSLQIRIGINCGPIVAGVIGKSKFIYDLWGDTVNLASRMESHGVAGQIHVSEAVYKRVKDRFRVEPRGDIEIKGKGPMPTYLVDDNDSATKHHSPV
jgi:class 3 adenylate cyclase/CHASE3 domain sensor protein